MKKKDSVLRRTASNTKQKRSREEVIRIGELAIEREKNAFVLAFEHGNLEEAKEHFDRAVCFAEMIGAC